MRDYAGMKGTDHPFARDGLTVDEICAMWRVSQKNTTKIVVLAQLCGTTRKSICEFLVARGYTKLPEKKEGGNQTIEGKLGDTLPQVVDEIRSMAASGSISKTKAAESVGISRSALDTLCRENGIEWHSDMRFGDPSRIDRCYELAQRGLNIREVAEAMGVTTETIRCYARRGGFTVKGMKRPRKSAI